ncbi:hypothetical protein GQ53DRAFT_303096 [Thozetella sp. PMI_491]|nr:hypothetical protein GQ53DRAFT_303096 [Thozetella sp. PMI_491]
MEERSKDNANPTIVSVSQLPTRRRNHRTDRKGPESKYDHVVFPDGDQGWSSSRAVSAWPSDDEDDEDDRDLAEEEPIDEQEIYDLISTISDPEHPHTLGQLSVVNIPDIHITPSPSLGGRPGLGAVTTVLVELTPTVNHCSLATVMGLSVRVRLEQALPPNYRVDVRMKAGFHAQDDQVNKQLADKERVAAALENDTLKNVLDNLLKNCV